MASAAHITSPWVKHHGVFAPVPSGTQIEADLFCGDRITLITGAVQFDGDGNAEPQRGKTAFSAWKYRDGGPLEAKIKAYRIIGGEFLEATRFAQAEADLACEVEAQRRIVRAAH